MFLVADFDKSRLDMLEQIATDAHAKAEMIFESLCLELLFRHSLLIRDPERRYTLGVKNNLAITLSART